MTDRPQEGSATPTPLPIHPMPAISAREQRLLDEDAWLVLEAAAYGYRASVKRIERRQAILDWLSIALAMWLLLVLWGVGVLVPPGRYNRKLCAGGVEKGGVLWDNVWFT